MYYVVSICVESAVVLPNSQWLIKKNLNETILVNFKYKEKSYPQYKAIPLEVLVSSLISELNQQAKM